jgi:hypothetical protein
MSDEAIDSFLQEIMQNVYPDEWKKQFGTALTVAHDGVGIFVSNIPGDNGISFAAGVLTDLQLSPELVSEVADLNRSTRIGGVYLSNAESDWQLVYTCKILKSWVDASSNASVQMLVDILSNIPALVKVRAEYVRERVQPARD